MPDFTPKALAKRRGLRKHESTALTQIRTGRIGLKAFLHRRRVPDVLSPRCSCGQAEQTPAHLFADCPETVTARRPDLPGSRSRRDFEWMIRDKREAGRLARWLLRLGKLRQFDFAGSGGQTNSKSGSRCNALRNERIFYTPLLKLAQNITSAGSGPLSR